jgi:hypothetical protein
MIRALFCIRPLSPYYTTESAKSTWQERRRGQKEGQGLNLPALISNPSQSSVKRCRNPPCVTSTQSPRTCSFSPSMFAALLPFKLNCLIVPLSHLLVSLALCSNVSRSQAHLPVLLPHSSADTMSKSTHRRHLLSGASNSAARSATGRPIL